MSKVKAKKSKSVFKKILITILCIFLSLCVIAVGIFSYTAIFKTKYETAENTVQKVLQITDVHILNNEKKDAKAFKTIRLMIEKTNPDIIMVTGDVTSEKDNLTAIKTFGTFIEQFNIPWGFTYGNHDAEGDAKKDEIDEYLLSLDNCFYERGDPAVDGHGNYYRNVTDKNGKVIMSLIMMDSNMYNADEALGGYDFIHENQIEWYKNTVKSIAKDVNGDESKVVPSLCFFHIPMQEYKTAYDGGGKLISGKRFETEMSSKTPDNMFETMKELGSTKGVFVGHDHMNDYMVEYEGIRLCYAKSSDHNIYVVPLRGGTLINIKDDGSFTTQTLFRHRGTGFICVGKEK